jgi:hypothetical protein
VPYSPIKAKAQKKPLGFVQELHYVKSYISPIAIFIGEIHNLISVEISITVTGFYNRGYLIGVRDNRSRK